MIALDSGDKVQGDASAASVVDYTLYGLDGTTIKQLADGQLASSIGDLYTADSADAITSIILVNTDTSARTVNLYVTPSGGTARRIIAKDVSLGIGYSLHFSGDKVTILNTTGGIVSSYVAHKDSHDPEDGGDKLDCAAAGTIQPKDSAAEGSAHSFARSDHKHATDTATVTKVGDTNAEGTSTAFARSDHVHEKHHSAVATITFIIDGAGSAITTGEKGHLEIPFACTITQVTTLADQSGSIVVDIWKDTYANFPPDNADSITASAPPTLSSATKAQDSTLTGWTTAIAAGNILAFNVDSITTCERVTISLRVTKT